MIAPLGSAEMYPQGACSYSSYALSSMDLTSTGALSRVTSDSRLVQVRFHGGDRLVGSTEIGTVTGGIEQHEPAVRQTGVDVLADIERGDGIVRALQHQSWCP